MLYWISILWILVFCTLLICVFVFRVWCSCGRLGNGCDTLCAAQWVSTIPQSRTQSGGTLSSYPERRGPLSVTLLGPCV